MTEALVSGSISVVLVFIEFIGVLLAKWTIIRKPANEAALEAVAIVAESFDPQQVPDDQDSNRFLRQQMASAAEAARREVYTQVIAGVIPGPELCFLALTILVALFLSYNYADPSVRQVLVPLLADSTNAFPIMFVGTLLSLVLWWLSFLWREALIMNIQRRYRIVSMVAIVGIGAANLAVCIYLLIAGR